jgi:APA family basic amino acid/polyamine antiporter
VPILWTYDGWQNLAVVAGEVSGKGRGVARALLVSIVAVAALYLLVNVALLVLLPFEALSGSERPAAEAAEAVLGAPGRTLLEALIVLSTFGALFGIGVAGPRFLYAMAERGLFFRAAARLAPGTAAPRWGANALFLATAFYLLTGTFGEIMSYYVAVTLLYNALAVVAVLRLRARFPDRERPFRTPGYPWTPLLFAAAALGVAAHEVAASPGRCGAGILLLVAAAPVYRLWRRRSA